MINNEIQHYKEANNQRLSEPFSAFITFQIIEGAQAAKNLIKQYGNRQQKEKLFGQEFEFQRASSPSDIIWENKEKLTNKQKLTGYMIDFLIFSTVYLLYFCLFLPLESDIQTANNILPKLSYCDWVVNQFASHIDEFSQMAQNEFKTLEANIGHD